VPRRRRACRLTQLLHAEFEDDTGATRRLARAELLTYLNAIAGAGNETTTRLIGWAGKILADHPDQRRELVDDPSRDAVPRRVRQPRRPALEEVLKRFPEWEVDRANARLAPTSTVRGWETLPLFRGGT
jgi:cytochrome P450